MTIDQHTSMGSSHAAKASQKDRHIEASLASIREALLAMHYGSVTITVHEDRVVQIDVTEKKRLNTGH